MAASPPSAARGAARPTGRGRALLAAALVPLALAVPVAANGQAARLEPTDPDWIFRGGATAGERDGEPVLVMRTGAAIRPDVRFEDGTIAFEAMPVGGRTFLGVVFRAGGEEVEDVYLRLHKPGFPDAVQYTPDLRGRGQWQLWHGPGATAPATWTVGEWVAVRIEVEGERAAVFVGDEAEPRLVVPRLEADAEAGGIGLWANRPEAADGDPPVAYVRNLVVRPGEITYDFPPAEAEPAPEGVVEAWGVSPAFPREGDDVLDLPPAALVGPWRVVRAEPSGLVPLERHVERPEEGIPAVAAGLVITADAPRRVRLDLGYSDDATVFVDGEPVYSGRHGFSTNFPRRQGLVTLDQASIHLSIEAGETEVVMVVSEVFGGWGVVGRIADREGLEVRPLVEPAAWSEEGVPRIEKTR